MNPHAKPAPQSLTMLDGVLFLRSCQSRSKAVPFGILFFGACRDCHAKVTSVREDVTFDVASKAMGTGHGFWASSILDPLGSLLGVRGGLSATGRYNEAVVANAREASYHMWAGDVGAPMSTRSLGSRYDLRYRRSATRSTRHLFSTSRLRALRR